MNRDKALPYTLAKAFLRWWQGVGQPEIQAAFHYWADGKDLRTRRQLRPPHRE
jgi:hypothetical protein